MNKTITVYFKASDLRTAGRDRQYADLFIKSVNKWTHTKIETRGFVTLNEVIEDLGMERKFKYIPYGFDTEADIEYDKERDQGRIIAKKLYEDPTDISMRVMEGK